MATGRHPQEIARELGLAQEHDPLRLGPIIDEVIAENRKAWEDYLAGNDRVVGFLVAKVRDKTGQTAKAALVNTLLREKRDEVAHQH
jgi:Asp-tRNA(Asn)/Glu-tRNA(Gln) amidotransferase B subunit